MNELELIIDLHQSNYRQGPGSDITTAKALSLTELKDDGFLQVADLGCGTGAQTFTLAQHLNAEITAVDLFPEFLHQLNQRSELKGINSKISTIEGSMEELPFERNSLDLIWSEGAIYNMGFTKGLNYWKQFVKPGGYIAVSEISWLTNERPEEIETFWNTAYPEIKTVAEKIQDIQTLGLIPVGYLILPESDWIEHYYAPLEAKSNAFLSDHNHSEMAQAVVTENQKEFDLYKTFKAYYSYGFYVMQKI